MGYRLNFRKWASSTPYIYRSEFETYVCDLALQIKYLKVLRYEHNLWRVCIYNFDGVHNIECSGECRPVARLFERGV